MKLIITIDTEEDNWGQRNLAAHTFHNIERIVVLQGLFDLYEVKPTYLVTYPVATNKCAINLLRRILEDGRCEIGTHCHPWNNPPFEEARNVQNSMLCNLSMDLQSKKIEALHQVITQNFGVVPTSFRAGRWGFSDCLPRILERLGYKVDSSIVAFQNWEDYGGPDFSNLFPNAFRWGQREGVENGSCSELLEIPATTGFSQKNFQLSQQIWKMISGKTMHKLHVKGILDRLRLLNKIWLSPEIASSSQMIRLTNTMMNQGYHMVNMFFHSNALKAGLNSFVMTREDEILFLRRVEEFLIYTRHTGIKSIKLSDAPAYLWESPSNSSPIRLETVRV